MDTFIEYIIKKQSSTKEKLLKVGIVLLTIIIFIACFSILPVVLGPAFASFGFMIGIGAIFGAYYLITSMNVEFEYALTNGELDVDKIIARRKRKRVISVKAQTFEKLGEYNPNQHNNINYNSKIFACSNPNGEGAWYAVFRHPKNGLTLLVFDPIERVLEGMKSFLPKPLMYETFVRNRSNGN